MILFELTETELHPAYVSLEIENGERHYDFLRSMVAASLEMQRPFLSSHLIKALNFHAIACLHTHAGEFRPCEVTVGAYHPPPPHRVQALMDDFVNLANRFWDITDPVALAAFVLWRLNFIHPFINGNGRTARAACYFVLCVKAGGWLAGSPILPELIRRDRKEYCEILAHIDASTKCPKLDLAPLHTFLMRLLREQFAGPSPSAGVGSPAPPFA